MDTHDRGAFVNNWTRLFYGPRVSSVTTNRAEIRGCAGFRAYSVDIFNSPMLNIGAWEVGQQASQCAVGVSNKLGKEPFDVVY